MILDVPIEDLLPHRGRMLLAERLTAFTTEAAEITATVRAHWPMIEDGHAPTSLLLELAAQAVGAFAGARSVERSEPIHLGFLVAIRRFDIAIDSLPVGMRLHAGARRVFGDDTYGAFEVEVRSDEATIASGTMSVYRHEQVVRS